MQPPSPLYHPPGQPFSIWTRKVLGHQVPAPARYQLLGRQFTVWTRSLSRPDTEPKPSIPLPVTTAPSTKMSWVTRAALMALPVVAGSWFVDHQQNAEAAKRVGEEHKIQTEANQRLGDQVDTLTKSLQESVAALKEVEIKTRSITSERDAARQSLKASEDARKAADATLQTKLGALTKASSEMESLRKLASAKESEFKQSLDTLRTELSILKQAAAQKDAEMQNALAKLEAEKASAVNEAAKVTNQVRELTTQLEKAAKETPAPATEPKP